MDIETFSVAQRRSVFAQLAKETIGVYYYSSDLVYDEFDSRGIITPLTIVSRNVVEKCPFGQMLSISLEGVDESGEVYGDWTMDVQWRPLNNDEFEHVDVSANSMKNDDIRALLRDAVNTTPYTLYHDAGRLEGLESKQTRNGVQLGSSGGACMMFANRLRHVLNANEKFELTFVGQPIGTEPGKVIKVTVTRLSMM